MVDPLVNDHFKERRKTDIENQIESSLSLKNEYERDLFLATDARKKEHCRQEIDDIGKSLETLNIEYQNLVEDGISKPKLYGALYNVPKPPVSFIERSEYVQRIKDAILAIDTESTSTAITASIHVGLYGMGGIGKSVLAACVAQEKEIRETFTDGIIWVTFGREPNLLKLQHDLFQIFKSEEQSFSDIYKGKSDLLRLFKGKKCLLILDDVWEVGHLKAFDILDNGSRMLITTRKGEIVNAAEATEVKLGVLTPGDALDLLKKRSGRKDPPAIADDIVRECGYLPLAVAMIGSMLKGKPDDRWDSYLQSLRSYDLSRIRYPILKYDGQESLLKAIEISVEDLKENDRMRYLDLAVFPEDVLVPKGALGTLWGTDSGHTLDLIDLLVDRSLAEIDDSGRIHLHDLQHDYVLFKTGDLKDLNRKLLEAYSEKCDQKWAQGPDDGYFFQRLPYHVLNAYGKDELVKLLTDFSWVESKLDNTSISALITDYDLLEDDELSLIQGALRLSSHILVTDKNQLASHLLGRLLDFKTPGIQNLLDGAKAWRKRTWLRPTTASFTKPGGPLIRTFQGHFGRVISVAITPNGKQVVSGLEDGTLRLWDLSSGFELRIFKGHSGHVNSVAITPDGKQVVSGSGDGTLRLWDLSSGFELRIFKGHSSQVNSVAITPDGTQVVSGSEDGTLKLWDLSSGAELLSFKGHSGMVMSVAITPDGTQVVSGSLDDTFKFWDLSSGAELRIFKGHSGWVTSVAITPDGTQVVSGLIDGTLRLWDYSSGSILRIFKGHSGLVSSMAITPDGTQIVSGSEDGTLRLWDYSSGSILRIFKGYSDWVNSVAVTPNGRQVVSGSSDCTLKLWDLSTGNILTNLQIDAPVSCVSFKNKHVVAGDDMGGVHFFVLENLMD